MIEIAILITLLCLGYGFGSYRERQHYESIRQREKELSHILVFENKYHDTQGHGGQLVHGNVVVSADYFKVFVAGLRKLVGGRLRTYESLLDRGRREAILRMKTEAQTHGANHIFNVRFETAAVSQGAEGTVSSVEVMVYGSAIKR